jgi:hypothetical protein
VVVFQRRQALPVGVIGVNHRHQQGAQAAQHQPPDEQLVSDPAFDTQKVKGLGCGGQLVFHTGTLYGAATCAMMVL